LNGGAENHTTDAAEAIDTDLDHFSFLFDFLTLTELGVRGKLGPLIQKLRRGSSSLASETARAWQNGASIAPLRRRAQIERGIFVVSAHKNWRARREARSEPCFGWKTRCTLAEIRRNAAFFVDEPKGGGRRAALRLEPARVNR
jgi:hypothetical protein